MIIEFKETTNKTQWHSWFAWYPVKINNSIFFLEYVERKGKIDQLHKDILGDIVYRWEYRSIDND